MRQLDKQPGYVYKGAGAKHIRMNAECVLWNPKARRRSGGRPGCREDDVDADVI